MSVLLRVLFVLFGVASSTTTTGVESYHAYDAQAVARVDVQTLVAAETRTAGLNDVRGQSALPSAGASGASTTPGARSVATEAESGLVTAGETCNSFEHDTDVLMADGSRKAIDTVKIGDSVIATDPATGTTGPHAVTALIRHSTDHVIVDVAVAGENGVETIAATDHHPFYVTSNGGRWVDAGALAVGDELRSPDGTHRVISGVTTRPAHETVYNLTIDGVHTYYVGERDPVLVHNSGCFQFGGEAANFGDDELAQLAYQHTGGGDLAGRPTFNQINDAMQNGVATRIRGDAVQFVLADVRVIINESLPWRSTVVLTSG